jgi:hypothetical protein
VRRALRIAIPCAFAASFLATATLVREAHAAPTWDWSTYYGHTDADSLEDVAIDGAAKIVAVGTTDSGGFIATPGAHDITNNMDDGFIVKFDQQGVRQWGTYFGGPSHDLIRGVAVDFWNNIYVVGQTLSTTGVATAGAHDTTFGGGNDMFIAKFNASGVLQWATYYGGPGAEDTQGGIAVSPGGNVYVVGWTTSGSEIASTGAHDTSLAGDMDLFVVKLNSSGIRQWATYYGGDSSDETYGFDIAIDSSESVYVVGSTREVIDFATGAPDTTPGGSRDAFVLKLDTEGDLQWCTYHGGSGIDSAHGVDTDSSGNVYVAGRTESGSSIAQGTGYDLSYGQGGSDGFLVKLNASGAVQWGTYYGGVGWDGLEGVDVVGSNVYVVGLSDSHFLATSDGVDTTLGGEYDSLLVSFSTGGARQWATYQGGGNGDAGRGVSATTTGLVVTVGTTESSTSIAPPAAHDNAYDGYGDGFISLYDMF